MEFLVCLFHICLIRFGMKREYLRLGMKVRRLYCTREGIRAKGTEELPLHCTNGHGCNIFCVLPNNNSVTCSIWCRTLCPLPFTSCGRLRGHLS